MKRLLLVRMSALGDIVHALPVLAALRDAYPQADIDWLADAAYAGILDFVRGVTHRVIVRPGYLRAFRFLRGRRYDAAVDLQGLLKSAAAARLSGARRVIGFARPRLRESAAARFYSETASAPAGAHVIRKNLSVLPLLGVHDTRIRFPLDVPGSEAAREVAERARAAGRVGYALLNPGAGWPNKRWPPDRFGALARRIRERFAISSFVIWSGAERELADAVVSASAGAAARAPETTLGDLLALLEAARLLVSGDTGPLHLATALGTPVVGIYGPTWPERNGPWDPDDVTVSRAAACVCHHKRRCRRASMCLSDITIDEVAAAVERRLATVVPVR